MITTDLIVHKPALIARKALPKCKKKSDLIKPSSFEKLAGIVNFWFDESMLLIICFLLVAWDNAVIHWRDINIGCVYYVFEFKIVLT